MRHPLFAHVQALPIALAATAVSVLPAHADPLDDPPEERRPPKIVFILAHDLSERYPDVVRRLEAVIEDVRSEPKMDLFRNLYE